MVKSVSIQCIAATLAVAYLCSVPSAQQDSCVGELPDSTTGVCANASSNTLAPPATVCNQGYCGVLNWCSDVCATYVYSAGSCGTGEQACEYLWSVKDKKVCRLCNCNYVSHGCYDAGVENRGTVCVIDCVNS